VLYPLSYGRVYRTSSLPHFDENQQKKTGGTSAYKNNSLGNNPANYSCDACDTSPKYK
jgi:hypothetical protein